jgi:transcriptional regulator with GAF, ATPase, and Fis domain
MKTAEIDLILEAVQALTFANPFGPRRRELEDALLLKLGDFPGSFTPSKTFNRRFGRLLPWLTAAEQELLRRASKNALPAKWRERTAYFAFFVLYHQLAPELDGIICGQVNDAAKNRVLYRKVRDGVAARHRLIVNATERIWNQPEHLFACYYQIRRAFHAIHHEIIGESRPIQNLRARVWESVFTKDMMRYQQWMFEAVGRFPTLILGPSGSGKELVARALGLARFLPYDPKSGKFADGPSESFHPINLSALSETLIESELFGHRKGAFTGAFSDRDGIFSIAGGYGSVFLDEIGEVKESTQVKLLRLLQSGEFQAIGDSRPEHYTGKIIAATHKDLASEMESGRFREDFYYRLCGDQVHTVALCEILADRPDELASSIHFICRKLIGLEGADEVAVRVTADLRKDLPTNYPWPGNFRELEQAVRNCIVRGQYQPAEKNEASPSLETIYRNSQLSLKEWTQLYVKQAVRVHGSYRSAAQKLGVDQRTVKKLNDETVQSIQALAGQEIN